MRDHVTRIPIGCGGCVTLQRASATRRYTDAGRMQLGYQTIIYGPVFSTREELDRSLATIAGAGFKGIELMQRPDRLGLGEKPSYADLAALLQKHNLTLIGLTGGTVQERVGFLNGAFRDSANPPYLYVEDWREEDEKWAKKGGLPLALHAHYLKRVHSLEEAGPMLNAHPEMKWIPDTAHLFIAGDDPRKAIEEYYKRLAAVHLKDWTPIFGRVSDRYARGFIELGRGDVGVEESLRLLLDRKYEGWLVVEQDSCASGPEESIWSAAEWLRELGAPISPRIRYSSRPPPDRELGKGGVERLRFLEQLTDSVTRSSPEFYTEIARAVGELYCSKLVGIWAYSDWNQILSLLASWPKDVSVPDPELPVAGTLQEIPLQRLGPEFFCLDETHPQYFGNEYPNYTFPYLELARSLNANWRVSIPVTNSFNPNHVRFLVNVLAENEEQLRAQDPVLISSDIARAADGHINELCIEAGAQATILSGRVKQFNEFLTELCDVIRRTLQCEGCTILLQRLNGTQVEVRGTTGVDWRADLQEHEKDYNLGDYSVTMEIFRRREPRIYRNEAQVADERWQLGLGSAKSWERVNTPSKICALLAPILDRDGRCIGVLRCRNKKTKSGVVSFTDSDLAVIDSILQIVVPYLFVLRAEEGRTSAFRQVKHEMRNPLFALRGVLDNLQYVVDTKFQKLQEILTRQREKTEKLPSILQHVVEELRFEKDYFGDAFSWIDLMMGLFGRLDMISRGQDIIEPSVSSINLRADIITPVIRRLRMELAEKKLQGKGIQYGDLDIPRLRIDKRLFEQVVFNLIDNAIKYAKPDQETFQVRINARQDDGGFTIIFQDWGLGIETGLEQAIFEEGVRGPKAHESAVEGQGLGLWLVRRIVQAHDGTIWLEKNRDPTEFRIFLPHWIRTRGPRAGQIRKEAR